MSCYQVALHIVCRLVRLSNVAADDGWHGKISFKGGCPCRSMCLRDVVVGQLFFVRMQFFLMFRIIMTQSED